MSRGAFAAAPTLPPGSRALVIGAGVSGLGAAEYLVARGFKVRASERSKVPQEKASAWTRLGVDLRDGGHDLSHLDGVALVVLSPGLPATHSLVVEARARRLTIVSEIDLALAEYDASGKGTVIAVTGTNGKSTTCAMLGHLLGKAGATVEVGGNFGDPPTAMLAAGRSPSFLVLELSSYQLEQSERVAPKVAVFTSFSHDHLARHGSISGYLAAKWRVFAHLPKGALALVPDYILAAAAADGLQTPQNVVRIARDGRLDSAPGGRAIAIVDGVLRTTAGGGGAAPSDVATVDLKALGFDMVHNQLNAAFALVSAAHVLGRSVTDLAPLLADFQGLAHRCEVVGRRGPHALINDSKSTNVESTLVALASQDPRHPVLLMMGGQGKGEPYAPILTERSKIAALITFGATGPDIAAALRPHLPTREFPTLRAALAALSGILEKDPRPVLFSPGCASFDEFKNYEERGQVFRAAVAPLLSR